MKMWDLAAAEDDRRFSPYCWRIKMALAHKGLEAKTIPWRFTDTEAIAFSGQDKVPVLVDGEKVVHDSWAIAQYLEEKVPAKPLSVILDLYKALHEKDRKYFRESREKRFGKPLEEVGADPKKAAADLRTALLPVRQQLVQAPFVSGQAPAFADYILFGAFQWARAVSPQRLLEPDDPVYAWRERMLDLHGGLARNAKGYEIWS
jgi:glutathione S-transferase